MLHFIKEVYNNLFYDSEYSILIIGHESSGKTTFLEQIKYMYNPNSPTPLSSSGGSKLFNLAEKALPFPNPAPLSYFTTKSIRPTVGMNFERISHYFSTLASNTEARASLDANTPSAEPKAKTKKEKKVRTKLILWDVGGQLSLRVIWRNYYAHCRAVIFLIDSTLSEKNELSEINDIGRLKKRYRENHETLRELFAQPDLQGVPFLLLSNKIDSPLSLPLPELQEALGLVDLALQDDFYNLEAENDKLDAKKNNLELKGTDESLTEVYKDHISRSGFGRRIVKLMEVSARDGRGVAAAMDWLIAQLIR
ncbi:unnamed protein product [Phytomonas sp. Hart1]|nr:unnamed protein product [Phytomonas sp. Hart1]|eukprot:CCW70726.1 unnamed protein product [Phytomonas sp. isolate Hart1]